MKIKHVTNTVKRSRSGLGYGRVQYKSTYFDWLIERYSTYLFWRQLQEHVG